MKHRVLVVRAGQQQERRVGPRGYQRVVQSPALILGDHRVGIAVHQQKHALRPGHVIDGARGSCAAGIVTDVLEPEQPGGDRRPGRSSGR
jgi:hypothetical protein